MWPKRVGQTPGVGEKPEMKVEEEKINFPTDSC
jgi:hypothetical protein